MKNLIFIAVFLIGFNAYAFDKYNFSSDVTEKQIFKKAKQNGFKKQIIKAGEQNSNAKTGFQVKGNLTYSFAFTPSAKYVFSSLAQNKFNYLQGVADCNGINIKQNGATWGWRWDKHLKRLEISPISFTSGKRNDATNTFGAFFVSILEDELNDFNPLNFTIIAEPSRYTFKIYGRLANGRIIDANSILPRKCTNKLQIATGKFNFSSTGSAPQDIIGYYRNESNIFTKQLKKLENIKNSVQNLILPD